jgi:hypothetical protein
MNDQRNSFSFMKRDLVEKPKAKRGLNKTGLMNPDMLEFLASNDADKYNKRSK